MDFEKQTQEMFNTYDQIQQRMWDFWVSSIQSWLDTCQQTLGIWEQAFQKTMETQQAMLRTEVEGARKAASGKKDAA